ncbi:MAG: polysaccharide biosynthesis/export family protein [Thermoanaerobaculia bacterium]
MKTRKLVLLVLLIVAGATCGVGSAEETSKAVADGNNAVAQEAYVIGPEDVLQISVWNNAALSQSVTVRPDGKISLPLLNEVQVAGLSPAELREFLVKRLAEYVPNPEVTIIVSQVGGFKVSVIGEVSRPGRFELKSRVTILDVLAMAGGFTQYAARSRVVVLRHDGKTMKRIPFNYNKVVSAGGEQENVYLRNGDIVLVP